MAAVASVLTSEVLSLLAFSIPSSPDPFERHPSYCFWIPATCMCGDIHIISPWSNATDRNMKGHLCCEIRGCCWPRWPRGNHSWNPATILQVTAQKGAFALGSAMASQWCEISLITGWLRGQGRWHACIPRDMRSWWREVQLYSEGYFVIQPS